MNNAKAINCTKGEGSISHRNENIRVLLKDIDLEKRTVNIHHQL